MELAAALDELPRHGIVEVHDIATYPGEPEPPLVHWERSFTDATLLDELDSPVRITVRPSLHRRREFLADARVAGLKLFAGRSYRYPGRDVARAWIREAHDAGVPVSVHALTADVVAEVLDLLDGLDDVPHRVVHAYEVRDEDVERIARAGFAVEAQPWDTAQEVEAPPWRALLDAGARVEFGSDWRDANLDALDPLAGVAIAVEHGLTRGEALAAYARGAVEPGAPADLVAVDGDGVALTLCGGRETYRR
jgi:predicted amidohydrolase YtcJ